MSGILTRRQPPRVPASYHSATLGDFQDADLVIADLTADGAVSATTTIALDADQVATADGTYRPPCPIWSTDGRWLAFGAGIYEHHVHPSRVDEVWLADTETGDIRQLPDVSRVSDIEWAPDAAELYIVSDGAIKVYSIAAHEHVTLDWSTPNDGTGLGSGSRLVYLALSPDGQRIAVQGRSCGGVRTYADGCPTNR